MKIIWYINFRQFLKVLFKEASGSGIIFIKLGRKYG